MGADRTPEESNSQTEDVDLAYYHEHYEGLSRYQLRKVNAGLEKRLRRKGLIEHIPVQVQKKPSRELGNLQDYYREHYEGLTRGELKKQDPSLYVLMRKRNLLDVVPVKGERRAPRTFDDPFKYYQEHYGQMTRGELMEKDKPLYNALGKAKLLHLVPKKKRNLQEPIKYYQDHYAGMTRGELLKADKSLYMALWRRKLLDRIPKKETPEIRIARLSKTLATLRDEQVLDHEALERIRDKIKELEDEHFADTDQVLESIGEKYAG